MLERKVSDLQPPQEQQHTDAAANNEARPLIKRHISMARVQEDSGESTNRHSRHWKKWFFVQTSSLFRSRALLVVAIAAISLYTSAHLRRDRVVVIPIEEAVEHTIDIGNGMSVWFRTWGTQHRGYYSASNAVPAVLFVHGGPGQAVVDYKNGNKRFFDAKKLFVVEVDQRGTGNSQPSVRDDYRNMKYYQDVSIDLIAKDFEEVRKYLEIDTWVVWGGSYGSTIALNYCMLYPESCTALLLRGIYLDTQEELSQVYSRQAFEDDERKLSEFNVLYNFAREYVEKKSEQLDPNDYEGLLRAYEEMISHGDKDAIWTWHSFENNLMEDQPENQLDPNVIVYHKLPEAQSVAFFETRLWLHGAFEQPSNLLDRVDRLNKIPIWMCQGVYDNVCPVQNAWNLVKALKKSHHSHKKPNDPGSLQAYFLDANHEDTDPVMEECLKKIMNEFLEVH